MVKFTALILLLASLLPSIPAVTISNECERKCSDWIGGAKVNIGIQGKDYRFVGNPNSLNRCDRVVFTIDIRAFLYAGKVTKAVLEYQNEPFGALEENEIGLEWIISGRSSVRPEDIVASDFEAVCNYTISRQSQKVITIDVTELVNKALAVGDGYITFRVINVSTETRGNPQSTAEGICIPHDCVSLRVTQNANALKQ